jgi:aspartate carbamoyltransferase catalytic subunit
MRGDTIIMHRLQKQVMNAKSDYNRFENAYKTGGVTKQQLDQAKLLMLMLITDKLN